MSLSNIYFFVQSVYFILFNENIFTIRGNFDSTVYRSVVTISYGKALGI